MQFFLGAQSPPPRAGAWKNGENRKMGGNGGEENWGEMGGNGGKWGELGNCEKSRFWEMYKKV